MRNCTRNVRPPRALYARGMFVNGDNIIFYPIGHILAWSVNKKFDTELLNSRSSLRWRPLGTGTIVCVRL